FPGQLYYMIVYLSSGSPLDQGGMHVVDREDVDVAASWDWISGDQKYPFFHVTDSVSIDANIEYVVVCIMDRDGSRRSEVWINELWI
ncbi:MAG: hypothetical protein QXO32_07770, partial [Candidatus Bathyarchaeia archaeon]